MTTIVRAVKAKNGMIAQKSDHIDLTIRPPAKNDRLLGNLLLDKALILSR